MNDAEPHLVALRRHAEDLRDETHGGAGPREDKERLFQRAVELLDPVARQALEEVNEALLEATGELADTGVQRSDDGSVNRDWTLSWPAQRDRGIPPVTISAWFGGGFHHPHLRGATVHDWPLNVYDRSDAEAILPMLRGIVTADVHNLIFQADWRIIPAVRQ
jgi:hypothetical protein